MSPLFIRAPSLVNRVNRKYKPVWDKLNLEDQGALAQYFLPHSSSKPVLDPTRPQLISREDDLPFP